MPRAESTMPRPEPIEPLPEPDASAGPAIAAIGTAEERTAFVNWLRSVAPYIHAFRNKTFVVAFPGELVIDNSLESLVHDLALLQAMGMRIVLAYGSRPQVEEQLRLRQIAGAYSHGMRITDRSALECAKEAAGELRLDIEAAFSAGLPNTPMGNSRVRIISGNFVTARPVGIIDGVDFEHTGFVRKVESDSIRQALLSGSIVLLPPLGFSPTGEAFNLTLEDVATSVAIALDADKLIFLTDESGMPQARQNGMGEISEDQAEQLLAQGQLSENAAFTLSHALRACRGGVARAHIVPYQLDGALLMELFTHDGVGLMLVEETLEALRPANVDDVAAIASLLEPLEADGTLVARGRATIERDIDRFTVIEHDGVIFGCAALYRYGESTMGELASLMVRSDTREKGDGERLLKSIESQARAAGLQSIFVLTTRTTHWFMKRGFRVAKVDELPQERQAGYNWDRRSQILIKTL